MTENTQNFSKAQIQIRSEIFELMKKLDEKLVSEETLSVEYPPENIAGDYTVPCFVFAKEKKIPPAKLSEQWAKEIKPSGLIESVKAVGPYLNFFVNQAEFAKLTLTEISKTKNKYGFAKIGKGKTVMLEYFGPNTNKPLTIGHLRNIFLGYTVLQSLKALGYKVIDATIYNDRGIALAKTIVAYQKWGKDSTPKSMDMKPDHFVGHWYVKFGQELVKDPDLEKEAKKVLRDWEDGEKQVMATWQKLIQWALVGYDETLKKIGIQDFQESYHESQYYKGGKEIVEQGLKKGVFKKHSEGYVYAELEKYGMPDKILLRSDGTSLYLTQDLNLAKLKNKYKLDQSIVISASEQDLHFKQLFKIIELLKFENSEANRHLSYGMIRMPDGKIKSREGLAKGTGADDLIAELEKLAETEVKSRDEEISQKELDKRATDIALAAVKFFILMVDAKKTMVFDPQQSIAFTGKTGPYIQYVHARINSIFKKLKVKPSGSADYATLKEPVEFELVKILSRFPETVFKTATEYNPSELTSYLYELAKTFSVFYENVSVAQAGAPTKKARLALLTAVQSVLAQGLDLLGISAPEKM